MDNLPNYGFWVRYFAEQGFQHFVYRDQSGQPGFYRKAFKLKSLPKLASSLYGEVSPEEIDPEEDLVLEISDDGRVLQFCRWNLIDVAVVDPVRQPKKTREILELFELRIPQELVRQCQINLHAKLYYRIPDIDLDGTGRANK